MDADRLADDIVTALIHRAEQDPGMSLDEVQRLLVLRVREQAEANGLRPRELMGAVWRAWERYGRPPILGTNESEPIVASLVAKGILARGELPGAPPVLRWGELTRSQVEERLSELTHEEQLFVRGILSYLDRFGNGPK
jgi:hypothetical protein